MSNFNWGVNACASDSNLTKKVVCKEPEGKVRNGGPETKPRERLPQACIPGCDATVFTALTSEDMDGACRSCGIIGLGASLVETGEQTEQTSRVE